MPLTLAPLNPLAPAFPLGVTSEAGALSSGGAVADKLQFTKVTTTVGGACTSASAYIGNSAASPSPWRAALYSESGGTPFNPLAVSAEQTLAASAPLGWVSAEFTTPVALSASTNYWVALWFTASGVSITTVTTGTGVCGWNRSFTYSATGQPETPLSGGNSLPPTVRYCLYLSGAVTALLPLGDGGSLLCSEVVPCSSSLPCRDGRTSPITLTPINPA
jgi:hypothetical protein